MSFYNSSPRSRSWTTPLTRKGGKFQSGERKCFPTRHSWPAELTATRSPWSIFISKSCQPLGVYRDNGTIQSYKHQYYKVSWSGKGSKHSCGKAKPRTQTPRDETAVKRNRTRMIQRLGVDLVQVNISPTLESVSLSETEKMWNVLYPAEKMEPEPDLGSQETQVKQNRTNLVTIPPQAGESCTICPTGLLSWLKLWARRWAVLSVVLNLILIIVIALPAKKSEPCPAGAACPVAACPDGWVGYLEKCYYFSQAEGNWTYSQSHCSALGASLAAIDTQQEMDFLMRYKGPSDHWIGLQREPDKPWMWTSRKEFNNWFSIAGGGLCAFGDNGKIASSGCSRNTHWICSKAAEKPAGRAK